jgi:Dullard-like phosphatase family protein
MSASVALPALVLDLDETLVFGTALRPTEDSIQVKVGRRRIYVRMRPGLQRFLSAVSECFDIYFFTASERHYADPIIDAIAPGTPANRRFFRENCIHFAGYPVKDLRLVERPLERVLMVDDVDGSALFQPMNLVRVSAWYGGEEDDVLLSELLPVLRVCAGGSDLRMALREALNDRKFSALHISRIRGQ